MVQKTLNALFGARRLPAGRPTAPKPIKLIAEIDEIPPEVAEAELDGNIAKLSTTGEMKEEWMTRALDLARLIGMTDLAPVRRSTPPSSSPCRRRSSDASVPPVSRKQAGELGSG